MAEEKPEKKKPKPAAPPKAAEPAAEPEWTTEQLATEILRGCELARGEIVGHKRKQIIQICKHVLGK